MAYRIAIVPGDGIGPEVVQAARDVVEATGVAIDWVDVRAGESAYPRYGITVPEETLATIRECGVALKGPIADPVDGGYPGPNIALRLSLGIYVNIRLARAFEGAPTRFPETDVAVIRDVTEDLYTGAEQRVGADAAIAIKHVSRRATERAAEFAFQWARRNGRRRLTVVHKAATLKLTDGLFLRTAREAAARFPEIACDDMMIDALVMQLVRHPGRFDVLLGGFQYGDILSDLCAGLAGGPGISPGALFGDAVAMFEPAHGSVPKYAGLNKVDPAATILSAAMMLEHLGERGAAGRVWRAVEEVIRQRACVTYDLGGTAGTRQMAAAIAREVTRLREEANGGRLDCSP